MNKLELFLNRLGELMSDQEKLNHRKYAFSLGLK